MPNHAHSKTHTFSRVLLVISAFSITASAGILSAYADEEFVYFGTHATGAGKGISLARFNTGTGVLSAPVLIQQADAPTYFVLTPDGKHLYTSNNLPAGAVSAYEINPQTGNLTFLNTVQTGGNGTVHVALDKSDHYILAADYQTSDAAVIAINPDGSLGNRTAFIQEEGHGSTPRQDKPYVDCIITDRSNHYAVVTCLGLDKIFIYKFDATTGTLTPNDAPFISVKPGSGPRKVIFSTNGKFMYLVNEIASTVSVFSWDAQTGTAKELQNLSALPAGYKGANTSSGIRMDLSDKFLFVTNRGHNSIAVFSVSPQTGILASVQTVPTHGDTPRNFMPDPTGKWIIVCNQDSNNVVVFKIDAKSGKLTQTGAPVPVDYPYGVRFLRAQNSATGMN